QGRAVTAAGAPVPFVHATLRAQFHPPSALQPTTECELTADREGVFAPSPPLPLGEWRFECWLPRIVRGAVIALAAGPGPAPFGWVVGRLAGATAGGVVEELGVGMARAVGRGEGVATALCRAPPSADGRLVVRGRGFAGAGPLRCWSSTSRS